MTAIVRREIHVNRKSPTNSDDTLRVACGSSSSCFVVAFVFAVSVFWAIGFVGSTANPMFLAVGMIQAAVLAVIVRSNWRGEPYVAIRDDQLVVAAQQAEPEHRVPLAAIRRFKNWEPTLVIEFDRGAMCSIDRRGECHQEPDADYLTTTGFTPVRLKRAGFADLSAYIAALEKHIGLARVEDDDDVDTVEPPNIEIEIVDPPRTPS